ncbi:MAG: transcriptional regulator, AraC family [Paenibacillus sp.]|jgi:AraC-like DNA-binding protein|nr:transcriptional regulator, AraC family [Paenibacillus sp.]
MLPRHQLQEELPICELVSIMYTELPRQFVGKLESYDFWQLIFLEYGEFDVSVDGSEFELVQGEAVFYKPNSTHFGKLINGKSSVLIIINFECASDCMNVLENKRFRLLEEERRTLSGIVREGFNGNETYMGKTRKVYRPKQAKSYGSEHLIRNYLEILLIQLIRRQKPEGSEDGYKPVSIAVESQADESFSKMEAFFRSHLESSFTIKQLCDTFAISSTRLKMMVKQKTGMGVIEYFNSMKIAQAKRMIREESISFAEIAERLGYSSNQQFSKQFKRIAKMSPSDYAASISARSVKGRRQ